MESDKKKEYYDLSGAVDEFRFGASGAKEKTLAGAKLFGKGLFNAAKFAVKEVLPAAVEEVAKKNLRVSNEALKREDLSSDQRRKLEEVRDKSAAHLKEMNDQKRDPSERT